MDFSHSVRLAERASKSAVDSHALVYWPEEDCASIVNRAKIVEGEEKEGWECKVRIGRRTYTGVIVWIGKPTIFISALLRKR